MITLKRSKKIDACDACKCLEANYTITTVKNVNGINYQIDMTLCNDCINQLRKLIDSKVK